MSTSLTIASSLAQNTSETIWNDIAEAFGKKENLSGVFFGGLITAAVGAIYLKGNLRLLVIGFGAILVGSAMLNGGVVIVQTAVFGWLERLTPYNDPWWALVFVVAVFTAILYAAYTKSIPMAVAAFVVVYAGGPIVITVIEVFIDFFMLIRS